MMVKDDARANQNAWSSWGCWTFLLMLQFWFLFSEGCLHGNNYEGKGFKITGYKRWLISDQVVFGHQGIHCNTLCVVLLCYRHHLVAWPVQLQVSSGVLWLVWSSWNSVYYTVLSCCASGIILVHDLSSHKSHQVLFDCWRVHGATYTVCCSVVLQASSWCMTCPIASLTRTCGSGWRRCWTRTQISETMGGSTCHLKLPLTLSLNWHGMIM